MSNGMLRAMLRGMLRIPPETQMSSRASYYSV